jgi:hypothetical protein
MNKSRINITTKRKSKDEKILEQARELEKHEKEKKILDIIICLEVIFITIVVFSVMANS